MIKADDEMFVNEIEFKQQVKLGVKVFFLFVIVTPFVIVTSFVICYLSFVTCGKVRP